MCVSDRVMDGYVHARYDPSYMVVDYSTSVVVHPPDPLKKQGRTDPSRRSVIGTSSLDRKTINELTRVDRWRNLHKNDDIIRLHCALSKAVTSKCQGNPE